MRWEKPLLWIGSSLADLRSLPREARRQFGFDLALVQQHQEPRHWKAMPSVGVGVVEVRVRVVGAYRLMYVAKYEEGIYVLHVFQKKSRKTNSLDIALARSRLAKVERLRGEG